MPASTSSPPAHNTRRSALHPSIRRVVLTGYMGAGKSTVGRALAAALGWSFLDVDDLVRHAHQLSIADIFAVHGEPAFRRAESRALAQALGRASTVIALGGGAPENITNRLLIEQTPGTCAVLLTAPFPVLFDRCTLEALASGIAGRPNLADPALALARFHQRLPHYRRLAHLTIDTTELSSAATLDATLRALEQHTPTR